MPKCENRWTTKCSRNMNSRRKKHKHLHYMFVWHAHKSFGDVTNRSKYLNTTTRIRIETIRSIESAFIYLMHYVLCSVSAFLCVKYEAKRWAYVTTNDKPKPIGWLCEYAYIRWIFCKASIPIWWSFTCTHTHTSLGEYKYNLIALRAWFKNERWHDSRHSHAICRAQKLAKCIKCTNHNETFCCCCCCFCAHIDCAHVSSFFRAACIWLCSIRLAYITCRFFTLCLLTLYI